KAYILGLHDAGIAKSQIARRVNRPIQSICNAIKRVKEHNSLPSSPRSGRPKKTSETEKRLIIRTIKRNPFISYASLIQELELSIQRRTAYSIIQESG
ncbi:uncharacterized protein BO97DRAFT_306382, partial [Aspergillus homomorphus CBS 101889]